MGGWAGAGRGGMAAAGAGAWWRGGWGGKRGPAQGGGCGGRAVSSVTSVGISIKKRHASRRANWEEYLMRIHSIHALVSMPRSTLKSAPPGRPSFILSTRQSTIPVGDTKKKKGAAASQAVYSWPKQ